jgi:hypothetical protein
MRTCMQLLPGSCRYALMLPDWSSPTGLNGNSNEVGQQRRWPINAGASQLRNQPLAGWSSVIN